MIGGGRSLLAEHGFANADHYCVLWGPSPHTPAGGKPPDPHPCGWVASAVKWNAVSCVCDARDTAFAAF